MHVDENRKLDCSTTVNCLGIILLRSQSVLVPLDVYLFTADPEVLLTCMMEHFFDIFCVIAKPLVGCCFDDKVSFKLKFAQFIWSVTVLTRITL